MQRCGKRIANVLSEGVLETVAEKDSQADGRDDTFHKPCLPAGGAEEAGRAGLAASLSPNHRGDPDGKKSDDRGGSEGGQYLNNPVPHDRVTQDWEGVEGVEKLSVRCHKRQDEDDKRHHDQPVCDANNRSVLEGVVG